MPEPNLTDGLIDGIKLVVPQSENEGGAPASVPPIEGAGGDNGSEPSVPPTPPTEPDKYALSDIFGDRFKSIDEVRQFGINERLSQLEQIQNEYKTTKESFQSLQERAKILEDPKFQSYEKYLRFAETSGIDDWNVFNKLNTLDADKISQLSDIDALVLKEVFDVPELFSEMQLIKDDFLRKYKLEKYAEENEEGDKVEDEMDKRRIRRDAIAARRYLKETRGKLESIKTEPITPRKAGEAVLKEWNESGTIDGMLPYFKEIPFPVDEIKGIKIDQAYTIKPEDQVAIKAILMDEIRNSGLELTKDNVVKAYQSAAQRFAVSKMPEMFKVFGERIHSNIEVLLKKKYSNFSWDESPPDRLGHVSPNIPSSAKTLSEIQQQERNYI